MEERERPKERRFGCGAGEMNRERDRRLRPKGPKEPIDFRECQEVKDDTREEEENHHKETATRIRNVDSIEK